MAENENTEEILELGGNIELSGFQKLDHDSMIVLKKIVGNYVKRFGDLCGKIDKLSLKTKPVHEQGDNAKHEVNGKLMWNGKAYTAEFTDKNIFFAIDKVLKKIEAMVDRACQQ